MQNHPPRYKSYRWREKRNPGKLKVGNSGMGAIYPMGVNIERTTGAKFNHIPYNEGGPSIAALVITLMAY